MAVERLKRGEIFEYLRPDQIDVLSESSEDLRFEAGATVYYRGEKAKYFYIVLEGQVVLRLPGVGGVNVLIDNLVKGDMFGSCVSHAMDSYSLTAQCAEKSEVLRIEAAVLNNLLNNDPRMGYEIQSRISRIYFRRYVETMEKLQAIVINIPLDRA